MSMSYSTRNRRRSLDNPDAIKLDELVLLEPEKSKYPIFKKK